MAYHIRDGNQLFKSLMVPFLISLTVTLFGPDSQVSAQNHGFSTSLNQCLIAMSDPGGDKSKVQTLMYQFTHLVSPRQNEWLQMP